MDVIEQAICRGMNYTFSEIILEHRFPLTWEDHRVLGGLTITW